MWTIRFKITQTKQMKLQHSFYAEKIFQFSIYECAVRLSMFLYLTLKYVIQKKLKNVPLYTRWEIL
jgi:hypothetical protein